MIDWNKLKPYKTTKQKSFEQLCYEVAVKVYPDWHFTPIDDSGGGDGVEFYVKLPDGTEWGWQAKYYEGSIRLSVSNRKQQIIKSLKRAIEIHPNLTKWFLCVPLNFTTDETNWFEAELNTYVPAGRQIELVPLNESFFSEKINLPAFNGLKQAFFGELELSLEWFQRSFDNSFSIVKNKFDEWLYTPNKEFEYWYVHPLLCSEQFITERIAYYPRKLAELQEQGLKEIKKLTYTNNQWRPFFKEYVRQYTDFNNAIEKLMPQILSRIKLITPNHILSLNKSDFDEELVYFDSIKPALRDFTRDWQNKLPKAETEEEKKAISEQISRVWPAERIYDEFIEELRYYGDHSCIPARWRIAHYLGNGGAGKTNFCVALAKSYLTADVPVIYLPAIKFTSADAISQQILVLLDIKSGYSFTDFLDALDALGRVHNKRIPIIIDGLNEAASANGTLNERLELDMPMIENEVKARQNVTLLTTCRLSYQNAIWKNVKADDKRFHNLYGFTNLEDKKRLINNYFDIYKIQADLSFMSLERFTKPLYLKIFCETVNPARDQLVQVTLGYDSIYSIFDGFLKICDQNIYQRLYKIGIAGPTKDNKTIASRLLKKIAERLWVSPQRAFSIAELMLIADDIPNPVYKNSITKALLDEELLLIRNWHNGEEFVYLTYDVMAGYFIADHLVESVPDFSAFFQSNAMNLLIGDDYDQLHPNHEDILNGLCSLLPIRKGLFLHDLLREDHKDLSSIEQQLFEKSIATTIMLSASFITDKQTAFISDLADNEDNVAHLLGLSAEVLFVTGHPFNFSFWAAKLVELSMPVRDSTWTEYIRNLEDDFFENTIAEFQALQQLPSLTVEQVGKVDLVADFLMWTFTSTNTNLKKKSANALYLFAIRFQKHFMQKYYASAEINDPTIFEWMSNVQYNAVIHMVKTSKNEFQSELIELSNFIHIKVLSAEGAFATNHLITRNYNYSTLSLITKKIIGANAAINLQAIKKSFKTFGVTNWKEATDINAKHYRDGNSLIDYHFHKEKMPYIMDSRGSEYNQTPAYKKTLAKLRWRAYQLGYKFELFGDIDKDIAKRKHWGEEYRVTERYADKYIEIAYLEYCGYLDSHQKLKNYEDYGYLRTFKLKHDPTQTGEDDEPVLPEERFPVRDYIDINVSLQTWCSDKSVPDMYEFLHRDSFLSKSGDWILLRGIVHQHKKKFERQLFFIVDTVFVKNKNVNAARKAFTNKTELGRANDSTPNTNDVHESEIPDAETIPYNEFVKWHYSLKSKFILRDYTQVTLSRDGKLLNTKDADLLWKSVLDQLSYMSSPRTNMAGYTMPMIRFTSPGNKDEVDIEEAFQRLGIELGEQTITKREKQAIDKTIEIFIPVRNLKQQTYLCKNMIDELRLSSSASGTDLYDADDVLASFSYQYEVSFNDQESFVYLRHDLLDKYLKDNQLTMFSIIWGERDYYPEDDNWLSDRKTQYRKWATFYETIEYRPKS